MNNLIKNNNFDASNEVGSIRNDTTKNKKRNCTTIPNNSMLLVTKPTVKSSSPQVNFFPYECNCENLNETQVPLICNKSSLACIIKNYFIYLQSRNLISYLDDKSITKLRHLQKYGTMVQKIRISGDSNYAKLTSFPNKILTLVLKSPRAIKGLAKVADTICCKEFQSFISKHCFCDVDKSSINSADDVLAQCIKTKNKY